MINKTDMHHKREILKKIKKAGSERYETSWDEKGIPHSKKKSEIKKGRVSRAAGARFELRVRKDLGEMGQVVDKWSNNVDLEEMPSSASTSTNAKAPSKNLARASVPVSDDLDKSGGKIVPAKRKFNPFSKVMTIGTGFPDFIAIKYIRDNIYSVIGVEVKTNGILSKIEKEKCAYYLKNKTFGEIWIAKLDRDNKKIVVKYDNFSEKYPKFLA